MIVEHEILEQILDDDWPLARLISFIESHEADPWLIVARHVHDGNVAVLAADGSVLADWRVQEILRTKREGENVLVRCTDKGADLVT